MPAGQSFKTIALVTALIALGAGVGFCSARYYRSPPQPQIEGLLWPNPKQLGPFAAIDQDGRTFGLDRLLGKWTFLFFGYTHCPDVCPITLAVLAQLEREIGNGSDAGGVQTVFVTVDPGRDTTPRLREYVRYFSPRLVGIGGTQAQIESLTGPLGIAVLIGPPDGNGNYAVDHSASVFLTDPKGRLVAVFGAPHDATAILGRFRQIRAFIERVDA